MLHLNPKILIPSLLISVISIVTIISSQAEVSFSQLVIKQIAFVIVGIIVFVLMSKFDYTLFGTKPIIYSLYLLTIILLILTLIFGEVVLNAKRWISVLGIPIQPSEIAKVTIILVTAYVFTLKERYSEITLIFLSLLVVFPIVLLIYLQPHGSMALICLILWFVTTFVSLDNQARNIIVLLVSALIFSGIFIFSLTSNSLFLLISLLGIIIGIFSFFARESFKIPLIIGVIASIIVGTTGSFVWNNIIKDYQRDRIVTLFKQDEDLWGSAFNVNQSKIAIGSGGIWGKGLANGTQSRLQFLPFAQTDFIFASYAESFGLIGSIFLLSIYGYLFFNIFKTPLLHPKQEYASSLVLVLGFKLLLEMYINIGSNLGISPATGIPLPLMSAGGTMTIMTFFSLGLIQCIITSLNTRVQYSNVFDR